MKEWLSNALILLLALLPDIPGEGGRLAAALFNQDNAEVKA